MLNGVTYNLPKPAPAAPRAETKSGSDDYARRHAEAFGAKQPPKADSGDKLSLSWRLDDSTRIGLKPSLKKGGSMQVELKVKF